MDYSKILPHSIKLFSIIFFLVVFSPSYAQIGDSVTKYDSEDYALTKVKVDKEASFKGGIPAWTKFLNSHMRTPDDAPATGSPFLVIIAFTIDTTGKVIDPAIVSDPGFGLGNAALKLIRKSSGRWEPAMHAGRKVKTRTTIRLQFKK